MREQALDELWAREQIRDALLRYCRGYDRQDYDLMRSAYFDDAFDDHGGYRGGVDGLLAWARSRNEHIVASTHQLGNCTIERRGDVAAVETYCLAFQTLLPTATATRALYDATADQATSEVTWILRYSDRMECRAGEWRIAERLVIIDGVRHGTPQEAVYGRAGFATGARDATDPSWRRRADVLAPEPGASDAPDA